MSFKVPVIVCVFNRPVLTRRLFAALAEVGPDQIFVVADGPRPGYDHDPELCRDTIAAVEAGTTWPCRTTWNVAAANLGCKRRIQSGLDWAFGQVKQAIVMEDDCVPDNSFFPYCAALLERYAEDRRVCCIAGTSPLAGRGGEGFDFGAASYVFSRYTLSWGWATWRRAWAMNDPDVEAWPALRGTDWLAGILRDPLATLRWRAVFDSARSGFDTWDYAWTFSCWKNKALAIHPATNLVSNVGFNSDATHTRAWTRFAELPTTPLMDPLRHPRDVERNHAYDEALEVAFFSGSRPELLAKARQAIRARVT